MADTNEKEGGSVLIPGAVAVGSAVGAYKMTGTAGRQLAEKAIAGALEGEKAAGLHAAATAAIGTVAEGTLKQTLTGLSDIKANMGQNGGYSTGLVEKLEKGFRVTLNHADGQTINSVVVDKLEGAAAKLLGDKSSAPLTTESIGEMLGKDGKAGKWVARVEQGVHDAVRKTEGFKKAGGGAWGAFKNASGGRQAAIAASTVAAVTGIVLAGKNLFSGSSHVDRAETSRANAAEAPAR